MQNEDKKYRIFFENSADAMLIIEDGIFVDCNAATVKMLGYDHIDEIRNIPPFKLSPEYQPDGRPSIEKAEEMIGLAKQNGSHNFEWDHLRKDGSVIPVEVSLTSIRSSDGDSIHTVWRDITERKESEKAVLESEHRFHTIFETIPDVITITRMSDGLVIDINPAYETVTGFKRDQLIGSSLAELGPWANISDHEKIVGQVREKGFVINLEVPMRTSDDQIRQALVSSKMINLHGEPHLLTIFKDISELEKSQFALKESEERFRHMFEANPDPVILASLEDGRIIDVNKSFVKTTGIARHEAIGHNSADLDLWAIKDARQSFLDQLNKDGEVNKLEAEFRVSRGQIKPGLLSARLISVNRKRCILIVIRDITAEKKAAQTLIEMDQIKNEFISTAAHELRTPITSIMGYSELLNDSELVRDFSEEQKQDFQKEIHENSERIAKIIDEIMDVSRIESGQGIPLDLQPTSIVELLEKVINRFSLRAKQQINLKHNQDIPESIPLDSMRITQVVENLLSNSVKYSDVDTEISILVTRSENYCVVCVVDQGVGMNSVQQKKMFDKFYRADSSDAAVRGLGLGMSIVKQIIEDHGGLIWVESSVGKGTKVYFNLPIK